MGRRFHQFGSGSALSSIAMQECKDAAARWADRVKVPTVARRRKSISCPDGGTSHISDRTLLCGPCNRLKSNAFTWRTCRNPKYFES